MEWTEQDFRWRVPIAGVSHSQPVIWGDRLFLTSATNAGEERTLLCLRKTDGKELWKKTYVLPTHPPGNKNASFANGSAVVDGERVIACFVSKEHFWVRSFDHSGKELWARDLGTFTSQHGHGASPIIYGNTVIVTNEQDEVSFVAALALETGEQVWKTPRQPKPASTSYSTPVVFAPPGKKPELILTSQAHGISSLDPETGSANWSTPALPGRAITSPVLAGDLVVGGSRNFQVALRLGQQGPEGSPPVAYTVRAGMPYVTVPLYHDGRIYVVNDVGIAGARDSATGRELWNERVGLEFFGSPVWIDGKIYCASSKGEMVVFATGDEFKLLARNPLGEGTRSTPCVDGGRLYMKTFTHLVCIGGK